MKRIKAGAIWLLRLLTFVKDLFWFTPQRSLELWIDQASRAGVLRTSKKSKQEKVKVSQTTSKEVKDGKN